MSAKQETIGRFPVEAHEFIHESMSLQMFDFHKTIFKEKMTFDDFQSAMYGKFVCEGKPIKKGFYDNFNFLSKMVDEIVKNNIKKSRGKNEQKRRNTINQ